MREGRSWCVPSKLSDRVLIKAITAAFVDEAVLQKVYERLQVSGPTLTQPHPTQGTSLEGGTTVLDPWAHFALIDAFDQPLYRYVPENHTGFELSADPRRGADGKGKGTNVPRPKMLAAMKSKPRYLRDRYHVIRQVVERNEHFAPPALPGGGAAGVAGANREPEEREEFMKVPTSSSRARKAC